MAIDTTYLCGMAATTYICTSLVVAAVRWFHMCRPYDRNPSYYYPGRPFVVACCLNALVLLPYALDPDSPDTWHLARLYFLPVTQFHFTIMLLAYFGNVMHWKRWRLPMLVISFPVAAAMVVAVLLALLPEDQIGSQVDTRVILAIQYVLGMIISAVLLVSIGVVFVWARRFDVDDYSNPRDFPVTAARHWLVLVLLMVVLSWVGALVGSRALLAVIMLLASLTLVFFLVTALHPHRTRSLAEVETEDEQETTQESRLKMQSRNRQAILNAIESVVVGQEAFLEPHLTLQEVADRTGYNRSYVSGLIKEEYGGFFNYINRLRLNHVQEYLEAIPTATVSEAAEGSGFSSRQAYYKAKKNLESGS